MALDVKVIIDQKKVLNGVGFGIPLVFAGLCATEVPYTECGSVDEVKQAGFDENTKVYKAATRIFGQSPLPPAKIAVYGGTESALTSLPDVWGNPWRQLIVATESTAEDAEDSITAIAAYVDAKGDKVFFTSVKDLADVSGTAGAITSYERIFCMYYPDDVDVPEAAVVGATAGHQVGGITYKNVKVSGLNPTALTDAQIDAAHTAGCYCVVSKAGDTVTSEGKTGDGEYLDVVDSKDWIIQQLEYRTQKTLNENPKVPYDNNGIALLESICVDVMSEAYANTIIAVDDQGLPDFTVDYRPRSATQASDREARRYVEGHFTFALAGAIHEAVIHGVIEI